MKKELFASALTLTASMACTLATPQTAFAKSKLIESNFNKSFRLLMSYKARYTTKLGQIVSGRIYLDLEQKPFTPEYNNQLRGEMMGQLYFVSDEPVQGFNGTEFIKYVGLTGDDGEVLLDQTHKDSSQTNTYQIYGCNSTLTNCTAEKYELHVGADKSVTMDLHIPTEHKLEIQMPEKLGSYWTTEAYMVPMQVTAEKN